MTNEEFFVALMHRLRGYDEAALLAALVALGATESPVRSSITTLAEVQLGGAIDRYRIRRASERLARLGLLELRVYPKTYTEYSVVVSALRALLAQPLPESRHLPGVSQLPIPFLARLQAESALDTAWPGASASLPPAPEDIQ